MTKNILLSAAALLLAVTATASLAADDYSRYAGIEGPNAPLMTSFAPNRDDALLSDLYGPYDYLFTLHDAMDDMRTAAASSTIADPQS